MYRGLPLASSYILPIYSPIMPRIINVIPLKIDLQPKQKTKQVVQRPLKTVWYKEQQEDI